MFRTTRAARSGMGAIVLILVSLILPAASATGKAPTTSRKEAPTPPNILFILVDDMGWHDWSGGGSRFYRTPNLDALAAEGMVFENAYASAAVCSPSRASLLTGLTPARLHLTDYIPGEGTPAESRFRVPEFNQQLPDVRTLARDLDEVGYRTAIIGKWHLGGKGSLPTDHGFDWSLAAGPQGHPGSYFWPYGKPGSPGQVPDLAAQGGGPGEYLTDRLTEEAIKYLHDAATHHQDRPFFLELSHYAVHAPLQATEADLAAVKDWTPADGQDNRTYAAMIHALDRSVGKLTATLKELHLDRNTVVVFMSDNGGLDLPNETGSALATSNAPMRAGKGFAYEGGLRVPLIFVEPGHIPAHGHNDTPVYGVDLTPTLLQLAGIKPQDDLDGRSVVPLLHGDSMAKRDMGWNYPHYWDDQLVTPWVVYRQGDLKLIHFNEDDHYEMYDLANDPTEQFNLVHAHPHEAERMKQAMAHWLEQQHAQTPIPRQPPVAGSAPSAKP
ncbi:sulfatase [Dyella agri]|uniref:Sulfatase n=1 Tax=Dyella agri TaxID=1926869 RepID=A0ABW8KFB0_9GAMM